jgi:hypothetical protein
VHLSGIESVEAYEAARYRVSNAKQASDVRETAYPGMRIQARRGRGRGPWPVFGFVLAQMRKSLLGVGLIYPQDEAAILEGDRTGNTNSPKHERAVVARRPAQRSKDCY